MSGLLFGINFIGKHNDDCFTTGSVKYVSKEYFIIDVNNDGFEIKIQKEKVKKIRLLKKGVENGNN